MLKLDSPMCPLFSSSVVQIHWRKCESLQDTQNWTSSHMVQCNDGKQANNIIQSKSVTADITVIVHKHSSLKRYFILTSIKLVARNPSIIEIKERDRETK